MAKRTQGFFQNNGLLLHATVPAYGCIHKCLEQYNQISLYILINPVEILHYQKIISSGKAKVRWDRAH